MKINQPSLGIAQDGQKLPSAFGDYFGPRRHFLIATIMNHFTSL
jgi:hypothetical protein